MRQRLKNTNLLPALWALACLMALVCYWRYWSINQLDADMASEQILANLLAQQPGFPIMSSAWYYSTELRVINTQLIMMPLFRLFTDWHTVRTLGSLILMVIYLASYFFFARKASLRGSGLFGMALLLLPFGELYRQYVLQGLYYIPHIAINFFALGCVLWAMKRRGKSRIAAGVLLCIASFEAGLGGPRQIAILQIPLTLAVILLTWLDREELLAPANILVQATACLRGKFKPMLYLCAAADVCGVAGYALNACVLIKQYHFQDQTYVSYSDVVFERLQWLIDGVMAAFGWQNGSAFSLSTVFDLTALLLLIFSFTYSVRLVRGKGRYPLGHRLIGAFFLCMAFTFFFLYAFTNIGHSPRYLLPLSVLFVPLFEIYRTDANHREVDRQNSAIFAVALAVVISLRGGAEYEAAAVQQNSNVPVAQFLAENGYTQGYASFWDGNILTELSNGNIEVWTLEQNNDFEVRRWLQKAEHLTNDPTGKVFFITSRWESVGERHPMMQGLEDKIPEDAMLYEDDNHRIYGFESADAMRTACGFGGN